MTTDQSTPDSGVAATLPPSSWAGEFRAQFKLGWPLIIAQLAQISLLTTDVVMLSRLGPKYLAAATIANAMLIAMQLFGLGVTEAVAPLTAQALGAGDRRSVRHTVRQGVWIAVGVALLLFPIIWNIGPIYHVLGQDPELTGMAETFVHFAIWMIFPAFLVSVFRSFLSAHGDTRVILWIMIAAVGVNALGDYCLIFGNWGFPRLEIAGAGIATAVTSAAMFGLILAYTLTHKRYRRYHIFHKLLEPDWHRLREVLRVGVPIGFMRFAEVLLFASASLLQGWIGQDAVAAHAIALQLASITFMVPLGISQATTVRVGLALGERDREGIRRAGWTGQAVTVLFMALTGICFLVAPGLFVSLFLNPTDSASAGAFQLATSYLLVAGLFQLFDGTQVTMGAALRGLSDTRVPLYIALVGYWVVGLPVSYVLAFPLGLQGVGIWWGLAAGLASVGIILTIRFAMRDRLGLTAGLAAA